MNRPSAAALALTLAAVLGLAGWAGWAWRSARAELGELRSQLGAAQARTRQAEATLLEAERLRAAGDVLSHQLAAAEAARALAYKERDDAILRATTGRPCLRADAVRVLDGAPGLAFAVVPGPAGGAAAADAAAAADPGAAGAGTGGGAGGLAAQQATVTDTDAARWMAAAGQQYETCRGRLQALIDFERQRAAAQVPAVVPAAAHD